MSSENNLLTVDWSKIPAPVDDGETRHLVGTALPELALPSTDGTAVNLKHLSSRTVVFVYPMTGRPGMALPEGWDHIPGARGCTPQACAFRDLYLELRVAGAESVFGLSTQESDYQVEAAQRLHLPFPLLSDANLAFGEELGLPRFHVEGRTLFKRLAFICAAGQIIKVFYPVFPPDRNAHDVLTWLKENPA